MKKENQTVVLKTYELLKVLIPILNKFPRSHKFTLADRIQNLVSDCLELLIEAYYMPPHYKKPLLFKVNIKLEQLRYYLRLSFESGLYSSKVYRPLMQQIDEIGRMTGGWIKSLKK